MFRRVLSAAALAAVLGLPLAQAQTIADVGGPANLPPAGFKGQQFVDSRGCVFLKAGYGGRTDWVPRVSKDRKVVCGYPPTFGAQPQIEMADEAPAQPAKPVAVATAAPAPAPARPAPVAAAPASTAARPASGAPMPTVASAMMPAAAAGTVAAEPAPYVAVAPASYQVATSAAIPPGKIGCFRSAPVAEVVQLRNGGTAVVCTRGDGTASGWRAPIYPAGAPVGASQSDGVLRVAGSPAPTARPAPVAVAEAAPAPSYTVPKGYKLAWDDDRLNPQRGVGTAQGWAQQDQVWTRTVPARLVNEAPTVAGANAPVYRNAAPAARVTVSSKNAPTAPAAPAATTAAAQRLWVQVGSFGVPENAQGAANRLAGLGLPVGKAKVTSGGKALQVVLAGPFASVADANAALRMARQAGFGDAFLR